MNSERHGILFFLRSGCFFLCVSFASTLTCIHLFSPSFVLWHFFPYLFLPFYHPRTLLPRPESPVSSFCLWQIQKSKQACQKSRGPWAYFTILLNRTGYQLVRAGQTYLHNFIKQSALLINQNFSWQNTPLPFPPPSDEDRFAACDRWRGR